MRLDINMFSQQIQGWHTFFSTVALAAAGLMGLIFLSLSLKLDIIRKSKDEGVRQVAWQTFSNFFFLIMFSFVFLVPEQTEWGLALPMFIISAVAMVITVARAIRSGMAGIRVWEVFRESVPSFLSYLGLIVIMIFMLAGNMRSLIWILPVVVVLLAIAIRNAWEMLVSVHK